MKVYRDISFSSWLMAAMLVATAQFAIAPRQAQARCGDYVMLGGHATHAPHVATEQLGPRGPNQRGPLHSGHCSGPMCSNDDPRPLSGPPAPGETQVQQWGLIAVQWLGATVVPQFAGIGDDQTLSQIVASTVYRPPR